MRHSFAFGVSRFHTSRRTRPWLPRGAEWCVAVAKAAATDCCLCRPLLRFAADVPPHAATWEPKKVRKPTTHCARSTNFTTQPARADARQPTLSGCHPKQQPSNCTDAAKDSIDSTTNSHHAHGTRQHQARQLAPETSRPLISSCVHELHGSATASEVRTVTALFQLGKKVRRPLSPSRSGSTSDDDDEAPGN